MANNDLKEKIIRQIEFYFGDVNVSRDKFMQEEIKKDAGWISIDTLTKFNRLKILSTDIDEILEALKESKSGLLELDIDAKKVRRAKPLPEDLAQFESTLKQNTVYVKGFPEELSLDQLYSFFEQYGKILKIFMKRLPPLRKFLGKVFVTFESVDDMNKFLELKDLKHGDNVLSTETEQSYLDRHADQIKKKSEEIKKKEEKKKKEKEVVEKEMKLGVVIHMKGFNDQCSREDIRELFDDYAKIEWINYSRGEPEAYLRLAEANSAKGALEKLLEAKNNDIELKGAKLECRIVEGEEELNYLKKEYQENQKKNNNRRQGKKNKGGFGKGKFNDNKKNRNKRKNSEDNDDQDENSGENGDDNEAEAVENGNNNKKLKV